MGVMPVLYTLKKRSLISSFCLLAFSTSSHSGRPMAVDDAALVSPQTCQLETWVQHNPDSKEYWAVPACNFGGNFEFAVGLGRVKDDTEHASYATLQGKTLLKPLQTNDWGIGFSFGTQMNTKDSSQKDWSVNVPLSISTLEDKFLVHLNLGWLRENTTHKNQTTWGIGTETQLAQPLTLIAEVYGNDRNDSFYQAGFKYMIYKDFVQLDASYGNQMSSHDDAFFSVGFVFLTNTFLP
jgi:hypothetical protein